jgi:hypothetical protein
MHLIRMVLASLALILTILAFAFSITATTSSSWSSVSQYTGRSLSTRTLIGQSTRGPLSYCLLTPNTTDPLNTTYYQDCTAPACTTAAPNYDEASFCQQLNHVGKLSIAGSVLTGVAMVAAMLVVAASGIAVARRHRDHPRRPFRLLAVASLTALLTLVGGAGCNVVASLWGTLLLVNQQSPDGNYITTLPVPVTADHWLMRRGVAYAALSWAPSIFAIVLLPLSLLDFEDGQKRRVNAEVLAQEPK